MSVKTSMSTTGRRGAWLRNPWFLAVAGIWSGLAIFAVTSGGIADLGIALRHFITGDLRELRVIDSSVNQVSFFAAATVVLLPMVFIVGEGVLRVVGSIDALPENNTKLTSKSTLGILMLVVVEELLARWLMLGVLSSVFEGASNFYLLFFIGNGAWALVHLLNYPKSHRNPLMVLPQFLNGVVFSVVYIYFGLVAVVAVHLVHDLLYVSLIMGARRHEVRSGPAVREPKAVLVLVEE
jgi:hypothetical protein